jgi:prepilin-type N-terminal cleavage/methylation domain-containing protein
MKKGFTLIELLIVVAIIAILAAIAVPNFLEAQTRAKISREKADMRSIATALETYRIDHNRYPVDGQAPVGNEKYPPAMTQTITQAFGSARLNNMITTPIAYLTTDIFDSFQPINQPNNLRTLRYVDFKGTYIYYRASPLPATYATYAKFAGEWQLLSAGPNKVADVTDPAYNTFWIVSAYDATNGTVSKGDIVRTQKSGEGYTYP